MFTAFIAGINAFFWFLGFMLMAIVVFGMITVVVALWDMHKFKRKDGDE